MPCRRRTGSSSSATGRGSGCWRRDRAVSGWRPSTATTRGVRAGSIRGASSRSPGPPLERGREEKAELAVQRGIERPRTEETSRAGAGPFRGRGARVCRAKRAAVLVRIGQNLERVGQDEGAVVLSASRRGIPRHPPGQGGDRASRGDERRVIPHPARHHLGRSSGQCSEAMEADPRMLARQSGDRGDVKGWWIDSG